MLDPQARAERSAATAAGRLVAAAKRKWRAKTYPQVRRIIEHTLSELLALEMTPRAAMAVAMLAKVQTWIIDQCKLDLERRRIEGRAQERIDEAAFRVLDRPSADTTLPNDPPPQAEVGT